MSELTLKAIIISAMCIPIAVACWSTKSGLPLWALIIVGVIVEELV